MKKRKKVLVGAVMLLTCGLHTVYGKYLYQESRIDVIHTAEFGNDSEAYLMSLFRQAMKILLLKRMKALPPKTEPLSSGEAFLVF